MINIAKGEMNNKPAFLIKEKQDILGYAIYEINQGLKIVEAQCEESLFDPLIRTLINFASISEIEKIEFSDQVDKDLITKYNFDKISCPDEFFKNNNNCKKNKS